MPRASRFRLACLFLAVLAVPIASRAQGMGGGQDEGAPKLKSRPKVVTAAAARAWIKLQQPITMPFEPETPLADVLKYIRQATADKELPAGLPIYVDPGAIEGDEKTKAPTVSLALEGVPLATSLELLAQQLGLAYGVQKDGVVILGRRSPLTPEVGAPPVTEAEARTWLRLQKVVPVPFEKATPLREVVSFLRDATRAKEGDSGLPIYVDPTSQQEEGEDQPTVKIKLDGVPLRTSLELMLDQLDLTYRVQEDGILIITTPDLADNFIDKPHRGPVGMGMGGMMMGGMGGGMGGMGGMGGGMGGMGGGMGGGVAPAATGANAGKGFR